MMTINDLKLTKLQAETGDTGDIDTLENYWLTLNIVGPTTGMEHTQDLWSLFLTELGFNDGTLQDRQMAWLINQGYEGETLNDLFYEFWGDVA